MAKIQIMKRRKLNGTIIIYHTLLNIHCQKKSEANKQMWNKNARQTCKNIKLKIHAIYLISYWYRKKEAKRSCMDIKLKIHVIQIV